MMQLCERTVKGGVLMSGKYCSYISATLCFLTLLPLTLAAIHWLQGPLEFLLGVHPHLPCLLSGLGVIAALFGKKGDWKFNLVLFNTLSLSLYLILITNLSIF